MELSASRHRLLCVSIWYSHLVSGLLSSPRMGRQCATVNGTIDKAQEDLGVYTSGLLLSGIRDG